MSKHETPLQKAIEELNILLAGHNSHKFKKGVITSIHKLESLLPYEREVIVNSYEASPTNEDMEFLTGEEYFETTFKSE